MTTPSLTPEERQRINTELRQVLGWKLWPIVGWTPPGTEPPFTLNSYPEPPDFCSSLDACALAEAVLSEESRDEYFRVLEELVYSDLGRIRPFAIGDATASQRSRALATIFARRAQQ